jgi:GrpB-like predicted nucleotidyltransferase (UPF0157 family)
VRILLTPYQSSWPLSFENEAKRLGEIVPASEACAAHVGSTSVPGMPAKPIVDMLLGVGDPGALDSVCGRILDSGEYIYVRAYEDFHPQRRFLIKLKAGVASKWPLVLEEIDWSHEVSLADRAFHIHIVPASSVYWTQMLAFRDRLRSDQVAMHRYRRLKIGLAKREWQSSRDYALAKDALIGQILA